MRESMALVAIAIAIAANPAEAGRKSSSPVTVWDSGAQGSAQGEMGEARNSAGTGAEMGCSVGGYPGSPGFQYANCFVHTNNGSVRTCYTFDPFMIDTIAAVQTDSMVRFGWSSTGLCTFVIADVKSSVQPKLP